jgi:tetratricopeptide (TPR) repeat protein
MHELEELLGRSRLSTKGIGEAARRNGIGYSTLQSWRTGEHLPRVPEDNPRFAAFLAEVAAMPDDAERVFLSAKTAWRDSVRARKDDGPGLVGRESQLRVLGGHFREGGRVAVIWGVGGTGKTALARRLAHDLHGDQCLAVDLRGSSARPLTVRRALAELLDPGLSGTLDTLLAAYRGVVGTGSTILLLDDAADARQVMPLLAADCLTLITSRAPLMEFEDLDGVLRLRLGPPRPVHRFAGVRPCPTVTKERDFVEPAYRCLPAEARTLFRRISAIPGADLTADAAGALLGGRAERAIARLTDASLLERRGDRYVVDDVLRLFGQGIDGDLDENRAALHRLATHYADRTTAAARRIFPDLHGTTSAFVFTTDAEATAWLVAERQNIVATAAAVTDDALLRRVVESLRVYQTVLPQGLDWTPIADRALRTASTAAERADLLAASALAHWGIGELEVTADRLAGAVGLYRTLRMPRERATVLHQLGCVEQQLGRSWLAHRHCTEALRLRRKLGQHHGQASTRVFLGEICADVGQLSQAATHAGTALAIAERTGYTAGAVGALGVLGRVLAQQGSAEAARAHFGRQLSLASELDFGSRCAIALVGLASLAHQEHRHEEALAMATEAATTARDGGNPAARVDAWNVAGTAHLARGRAMDAVALHRSALRVAEHALYRRGRVDALRGLAAYARAARAEPSVRTGP